MINDTKSPFPIGLYKKKMKATVDLGWAIRQQQFLFLILLVEQRKEGKTCTYYFTHIQIRRLTVLSGQNILSRHLQMYILDFENPLIPLKKARLIFLKT